MKNFSGRKKFSAQSGLTISSMDTASSGFAGY
jgi:hypothetical protein